MITKMKIHIEPIMFIDMINMFKGKFKQNKIKILNKNFSFLQSYLINLNSSLLFLLLQI